MGQRGPKPLPTKVLELRGSWRATNRVHEPQVPAERPSCPAWLSPEAKKIWNAVVGQLHHLEMLTRVDGHALARYCALTVRWKTVLRFVEEHGDTYPVRDLSGQIISLRPFPQTWLVQSLSKELSRIEAQFGMSPSSRATLHVALPTRDQASEDHKSHFFRSS